ncbi:lysozyme inhibitor LprI family protein [uncultured Oxalicibacterium sp.]|uniref:lysozyme inhibitor LprI family protein n=1 Tax=uncultured Oxalicibacterium sp. TaxID=1168540 RepID=UPI0025FC0397|nr:lysozyme inhibitor LprI family protein [uncultured Oxalicibacterium sp.]
MNVTRIVSTAFVMSLFCAASIVPAQAEDAVLQEALKDCERNQMTMNLCAGHRYTEADRELNRQYKRTMAAQSGEQSRKRLRDAQRAWITFRDKDCLAENGPREQSGSIWPLLQATCLTQHTERRTQDLARQACGMEGCSKP